MARSAHLTGRTLADIATNLLQVAVMIAVGYLVGFRFATSVGEVALGLALLVLLGYSFSWISALIGLLVRNVEAAQSAGFVWLFPLTFVSAAFVPPETMPAALEWFAQVNPITVWVVALRGLFLGVPTDGEVWRGIAWAVGLVAVFAPLAVARYRRVLSR
jgi:ABC-2 type transport system permease protein/oleandomycin transport system permease protein